MPYQYEEQKPFLFADEGQRMFLKVRHPAQSIHPHPLNCDTMNPTLIKGILDNFDMLIKVIKNADNLPLSKHKVCIDAEIASLQIQVLLSQATDKP